MYFLLVVTIFFLSLLLLSLSFYFVIEVRYRLLAYSLARLSFLFSTVTHLYQVPYQQLIIFRKTLVFFFLFLCTRADKATISDFPRVRVAHSSDMRVWMRVILFLSLPFIYFFFQFFIIFSTLMWLMQKMLANVYRGYAR